MKTLLFAAALLSLSPVTIHIEQARPAYTGDWTLRLSDRWSRNEEGWVSLQLERGDARRWGTSVRLADLEGLGQAPQDFAGDARFTLKRDAGTIEFEGLFADGRGRGTYRFTPSQAYIDDMRQMGFSLNDEEIFSVMALDVSRPFVRSIQGEGYRSASLQDLVRMRIHGVDAEYIRAYRTSGYDGLKVADLVKTRIHGATPRFVQDVKSAGLEQLSIEQLIKMRIHGVTPAFIREIREAGYKDLTIEQLVRLRIHGVTPAFIKEIRGLGYTDLSLDDYVKMRIHGVTPSFIRELRELGYGSLPATRLVQFRIHGVTPEFVREARAAGFKDLDAEELVDLSIHGRRWLEKRR